MPHNNTGNISHKDITLSPPPPPTLKEMFSHWCTESHALIDNFPRLLESYACQTMWEMTSLTIMDLMTTQQWKKEVPWEDNQVF